MLKEDKLFLKHIFLYLRNLIKINNLLWEEILLLQIILINRDIDHGGLHILILDFLVPGI